MYILIFIFIHFYQFCLDASQIDVQGTKNMFLYCDRKKIIGEIILKNSKTNQLYNKQLSTGSY